MDLDDELGEAKLFLDNVSHSPFFLGMCIEDASKNLLFEALTMGGFKSFSH
jgi:hypothetical protein